MKTGFNSAVIVAGGRGRRMNMDVNKQFVPIGGKPVLAWTLEAFDNCDAIDEIVLVVNQDDMEYCRTKIIKPHGIKKMKAVVPGGLERQNSVYNGIRAVSERCDFVLIHDGARPFIRETSIKDSLDAAHHCGAACVAVPVKDTIKTSDDEGYIQGTLDRSKIWSIQTPQVFRYPIALEAHEKALQEGYLGTDDAVLAERAGYRVKLVMGSYDNIKITTREDLILGKAILDGCT